MPAEDGSKTSKAQAALNEKPPLLPGEVALSFLGGVSEWVNEQDVERCRKKVEVTFLNKKG